MPAPITPISQPRSAMPPPPVGGTLDHPAGPVSMERPVPAAFGRRHLTTARHQLPSGAGEGREGSAGIIEPLGP